MASLTWWTWLSANSGSWWWTGKPGMLQSKGSQRIEHDWMTELNPHSMCVHQPGCSLNPLLLGFGCASSCQSVQFSSVAQSCPTLWDPMDCSMPGLPVHHQLLEFTQAHVHWIGGPIQPSHLCHPLLLLPPISPSIRVFSNESTLCIKWPKYWSFSFSISPSNEHPGLICFRTDWLDLLAVQGTLKSLPQHHSSKASILWCSAFFTVQLSHPYMTTGKTIALTRWTFVDKVMSLHFNMLSRLVITFLPRSKHLLISWLQSPSAVILEPPKNKVWPRHDQLLAPFPALLPIFEKCWSGFWKSQDSFFKKTFYFVLGYNQLTKLWQFQVNGEGTQPQTYRYPFSPKSLSHPGCYITLSRALCNYTIDPCWLSILNIAVYMSIPNSY